MGSASSACCATLAERYLAAEAAALPKSEREIIFKSSTLKLAAFEGNVADGKVEVGQAIGLIDDLPSAGDLVTRLMRECVAALERSVAQVVSRP